MYHYQLLLVEIDSLCLPNRLPTTPECDRTKIQQSFKEGQASNLIPIQQVPIQIAPPFYFLAVYAIPVSNLLSLIYLCIGIVLIIISSFLLGKRQVEIEKIK